MDTIKIGILEPEDFSHIALTKLQTLGSIELYDGKDIDLFISNKDVLFVRLRYNIDDELIRNASNLKYICSPTTGLNHIEISNSKIHIICLKGEYEFLSTIRATPEHVFGITLGLLRNYSHAFLSENNKNWNRDAYKGYEIYNSRVGIIGLGRVGKIIANYFTAFDAKVSFYDILPLDEYETKYTRCKSIDELIANNDIIILSTNYNPENSKMITAQYFKMMKGKYFINAARGELIDEDGLLEAIEENVFAGVAVDVLDGETKGYESLSKLITLQKDRNIIITPHIGGATFTSMKRTEEFITDKLISIISSSIK